MMKTKSARLRFCTMLAFAAICAVGFFTRGGIGNACAAGWDTVTLVCPLGAILAMISERTAIPLALVSVVAVLIVCLVLGRVFCSWLCPVHFMSNGAHKRGKAARTSDRSNPLGRVRAVRLDSRHAILAAAIVSTLLVGFPVFCLVCPIGLTFALVLLIMRLFVFGETTWTIVLFLAVLVAEVVLLPHWCNKLCPLGALLSLFSTGNRTFRPHVNGGLCLETAQGIACDRCTRACHVGIDLHDLSRGSATMSDCTKCRACAEACPRGAITFPPLPSKAGTGSGSAASSDAASAASPDENGKE